MADPRFKEISKLIMNDEDRMRALKTVQQLGLPDCWIGAGFIRNILWDQLHDYRQATPSEDIDVIYHDPTCLDEAREKQYEAQATAMMPGVPWSFKNQARMHLRNNDQPYQNTEDAMRHWIFTATAVAARLNAQDEVELIAPFGLDDWFALQIVPTPYANENKPEVFINLVETKPWLRHWPKLSVVYPVRT